MSRRAALQRVLAILMSTATGVALAADYEEGGYAGTRDQGHTTVVYNFLKHFSFEQYYYSAQSQWASNNNARVDNMDFSVFGGHGAPWTILGEDGLVVDLTKAGSRGNLGYGDADCEFVAFESCKVVPSPIEKADWYTNWTRSGGIFDGLHQALGFRTNSYQSTDQDVTDWFGIQIKLDYAVWQAWFLSIDIAAYSYEYGSAVMYPAASNDTYSTHCPDPPKDHTDLTVWYQY